MSATSRLARLDHPRGLAAVLAVACTVALAIGVYVQHGLGEAPCSLCVLQRLAFIVLLLLVLPLAAIRMPPVAAKPLAVLALLAVLAGLGIAAYQVSLQLFPTEVARCGRGPAAWFEDTPFATLAGWLLDAEGDCGKPVRFLGLVTLPQIGLAGFVAMLPIAIRLVVVAFRPRQPLPA